MCLRKKMPAEDFFKGRRNSTSSFSEEKEATINIETKEKIRKIANEKKEYGKSILLDDDLKEIKKISNTALSSTLRRMRKKPFVIITDGAATVPLIRAAEDAGVRVIVARNFTSTDTKIELMGF